VAEHRPHLAAARVSLPDKHPLRLLVPAGAGVGVLALVATFALGLAHPHELWVWYLLAFLYWLTLALGGLFFVLVQFATRAGWSVAVRRVAEHVAGTLPLFVLLFVPLAFAVPELFHWSDAEAVAADPLLAGKHGYLNAPFFLVRAALVLAAWAALGWWFRRRSVAQDAAADPRTTRLLQSVSAPALIVFAVSLTVASFDWIMSLDPHWYSTIFGVYVFSGCAVAVFALVPLLAIALEGRGGPLEGVVTAEHYHDLGKLLFGFVVFWAYIAFSQYMLVWYGNIPEETIWYAHRLEHGWEAVTVALALAHFVVPFFYLLLRRTKRNRALLAAACVWLLAAHGLDLYWLVMPAVHPEGVAFSLLGPLAWLGVGGLVAAALGWLLRRPAAVPVGDPRLPESLSFENM
jgi:hypothetical protein